MEEFAPDWYLSDLLNDRSDVELDLESAQILLHDELAKPEPNPDLVAMYTERLSSAETELANLNRAIEQRRSRGVLGI